MPSVARRAHILALPPFDGWHADVIAAVVRELADRLIPFIATTTAIATARSTQS